MQNETDNESLTDTLDIISGSEIIDHIKIPKSPGIDGIIKP